MSKRHFAFYLSLLTVSVFLVIYDIKLRNTEQIVACVPQSDGNTVQLPEVAIPQSDGNTVQLPKVAIPQRDGNTAQLPKVAIQSTHSVSAQRWRERVAASGNCTLRPVVPTWDNYFDMVVEHKRCTQMKMFGGPRNSGKGDGAKNVCMDANVAPKRGACTVISVGINNEWSFDDAMAAWGCEVYSFDPTIAAKDHQRGARIHFHSLGLSDKSGTIATKKGRVPVESYRGILGHVGLINRTIDYLKVDIEGSEIPFFENVLYHDLDALQHVKQIAVEIHVFKKNPESRDQLWKIYHRLECLGFRKVYSEKNTYPGAVYTFNDVRPVSCCYELVWVNEAYL